MLEETDGLDESADGVPLPNTAAGIVSDYALPDVVPRRTHPSAIVALVLAFVVPVVGIVLAHRVIRKLQHDGGRGHSVAQAAIVLGYLSVLLIALVAVNVAVAVLLHPVG